MATNFWSLRACCTLRMRLAFFLLIFLLLLLVGATKRIVEIWVQIKYDSTHEPEKWY